MFENILIFRTDRIGDLIVTCPAILTIKKYFVNSNLTLVTSKKNYIYAINLNIFNKVIQYPQSNLFSRINFIYKLAKKKFDYIFVFDGKNRSIISTAFIKSQYKVALIPGNKNNIYLKLFKIKFFKDDDDTNLNEIFQKMINFCKVDTKINNYDFLSKKKNNNFSLKIPIKNYVHIHLDEKWFTKLYISSYKEINPSYDEFVNFIQNIVRDNNLLITTGLINFDLIQKLKKKFLNKKSDKIYYNDFLNNSVYLINYPTFEDIESLLRSSKILISCHGAVTHAANSFNVKNIDIIEESKVKFYQRFTSYLKNYSSIYRSQFSFLQTELLNKIKT